MRRLLAWLVALDVFLFACICLGNVKRNETASSAAWSSEQDGKWTGRIFRPLIDWLFSPIEQDHCLESWLTENSPQPRPLQGGFFTPAKD